MSYFLSYTENVPLFMLLLLTKQVIKYKISIWGSMETQGSFSASTQE